MDLVSSFLEYEAEFDAQVLIDYTRAHAEIPVFAVCLYLGFVTYIPGVLPFSVSLRKTFAAWNLILSLFSIVGVTRILPVLLRELSNEDHGDTFTERFVWTCCTDPKEWYLYGSSGLWTGLFIYSKFPELLDTAFLVLQKKRVIFLHWFHHCTVLLYCWHAFHHRIAPGIWFAAMNYSVHSIMYFYYFLSSIGMRSLVRPIAPFITFIQIAQMFVGISVTVTAAYMHSNDPSSCATDGANWKLGLGMYFAYFCLFCVLFWNLYCTKKPGRRNAGEPEVTYKAACDVGDAAGFFRGKDGLVVERKELSGTGGTNKVSSEKKSRPASVGGSGHRSRGNSSPRVRRRKELPAETQ